MDNTVLVIVMTLISGLFATMLATIVTLIWQKRTATNNRKMKVFETLMIYRDSGQNLNAHLKETVPALNSIVVIFYDDNDVREAYKDYLDECDKSPEMHSDIFGKYLILLEIMANSLGLKKLRWKDIKRTYLPNGYVKLLKGEEIARESTIVNNNASVKFMEEFKNRQPPKEEKFPSDQ